MTRYYCKCGRIEYKSTNADNTGNRLEDYAPGHECFGCPYALPWGKNKYEAGRGFRLEIKGYECRMSKDLEYTSAFSGEVDDKTTCYIVSLDFDFLERVSNWIAENHPGGELNGRFDRSEIRPVEYSSNGRYRLTIACSQNKAGMAAKAALLERFFYPDGSRKDMTPEREKEKILNDIKAAIHKEAIPCAANNPNQSPTPTSAPSKIPSPGTAPGASTGETAPGKKTEQAPCKCMTCTCDGCHEECFGHCHGCGKLVRSCNSYQTEGEKNFSHPADAGGSKLYFKKAASLVYRFSGTGRFQFWLFSGHQEWKFSDFLNHTYALKNRENLKPPSQWLADYAAAQGWPEITQKEFDVMCKNMSVPTAAAAATTESPAAAPAETLTISENAADAKISKDWRSGATGAESLSAPHSLAEISPPAPQSPSLAESVSFAVEPERPAFDYSGLDVQAVDTLHLAERMIREARRDYVITVAQAVGIVHEELCGGVVQNLHNSKHGNRGDDTFGAWCASVGIGRRSAYNLLQVNALMQGATPEEQAMLEQASPSLLYAAAKPSAPAELVQGVKDGDITTHKQYQELLAQIKAKDDEIAASKAQRDAALADVDGLSQQNAQLKKERDEAHACEERARESAHRYHVQAEEATAARNALLDQQAEYIQAASEKDARIRELESRPIEVGSATPEDIARWRAEGAEQARKETQKELRRANAETAKERKRAEEAERDRDEYADTMEKYATQLGELRSQQDIDPEDAERMSFIANSIENSRNLLVQALDRAEFLPNGLCAKAMALLADHGRSVLRASEIQCWPTRPEDFEDEPDEWPEEDEEDDADV